MSYLPFLGEFAKLRKAIISFVMSVRPSVWNNLGSHWTDFYEIFNIWLFFENMSKKPKFHYNRTRI